MLRSGERNFHVINQAVQEKRERGEMSAREYKHFKRWSIQASSRLNAKGELINHAKQNDEELQRFLRNNTSQNSQRVSNGHWESVSPPEFVHTVEVNGRVNAVAIDPTNSNRIYAGTALGGLWRTSNGGSTWESLIDGFVNLGISGIVIDHIDPDRMFILTGDGDSADSPCSGVFVSYDAGISWEETGLSFDRDELCYGFDKYYSVLLGISVCRDISIRIISEKIVQLLKYIYIY